MLKSSLACANVLLVCSTPHGIGANGTSSVASKSASKRPRAQRLTASGRTAPDAARRGGRRSTKVLNASRHRGERHYNGATSPALAPQLCSTPHGIGANGTGGLAWNRNPLICAQRLTASGRTAPCRHATPTEHRSSAQRLTASGRTAPPHGPDAGAAGDVGVLNASRHRGERHAAALLGLVSSVVGVLNASRHRGERHVVRLPSPAPPVGRVLNASRHRGERHTPTSGLEVRR